MEMGPTGEWEGVGGGRQELGRATGVIGTKDRRSLGSERWSWIWKVQTMDTVRSRTVQVTVGYFGVIFILRLDLCTTAGNQETKTGLVNAGQGLQFAASWSAKVLQESYQPKLHHASTVTFRARAAGSFSSSWSRMTVVRWQRTKRGTR